jgi:hypothetical protein
MAESPHTSVRNQVQDTVRASERPLSANALNSNAERRLASMDSIKRLEHIIAVQEDRMKNMRHSR